MKSHRNLIIGVALLLAGVAGLMTTGGSHLFMGGMMGMMHDIKAPADGELATLEAYLQKYAQKPIDKTQYEDLNTPAGKLFDAVCSQCHALPDPKQYTADEWLAVVQRMRKNMKIMGKSVPDGETVEMILGFLQQHAR